MWRSLIACRFQLYQNKEQSLYIIIIISVPVPFRWQLLTWQVNNYVVHMNQETVVGMVCQLHEYMLNLTVFGSDLSDHRLYMQLLQHSNKRFPAWTTLTKLHPLPHYTLQALAGVARVDLLELLKYILWKTQSSAQFLPPFRQWL